MSSCVSYVLRTHDITDDVSMSPRQILKLLYLRQYLS